MNYVKSVCVPGVLEVAVGADGSSASSPKYLLKIPQLESSWLYLLQSFDHL